MVDVAPQAAPLDTHGALLRVNADAMQVRQIDHQAFVAHAQAATVVAAAAHCEQQLLLAGEIDAAHHVGHVAAIDDQAGHAIDHRVVDLARVVVVGVARLHHAPAQLGSKFLDEFWIQHDGSPVRVASG